MDSLKLTDLLRIEILQRIQDSFSAYTGIPAVITDEKGIPLIEREGDNADFCFKLTRKSKKGDTLCRECDKVGVSKANQTGKPVVYICHAGLVDFAVPILLGDRVIGGIVGGQVRPHEVDEAKIRKVAEDLDIDPDEYIKAAKKTLYVPFEQVEKAAKFLGDIAKNISLMAYDNYCAIEKSRKAERAARSHTDFLISVGKDFSKGMKGWLTSIIEISDKCKNISDVSEEFDKIISRGKKLHSMVSGAVDYIYITGSNIDFIEGIYDVREIISDNVYSAKEEDKRQETEFSLTFDDALPQFFIGNSGQIGLIVKKILLDGINSIASDKQIAVSVSCKQALYSTNLIIKIDFHGNNMDADTVEKIIQFVNNADLSKIDDKISNLDIPMIYMLINSMSGKVTVKKTDAGVLEVVLMFPQLIAQNT